MSEPQRDQLFIEPGQLKLGPILLAPGVLRRNAVSFILVAMLGFSASLFLNFVQPYIFAENLHLATAVQGRVSGQLVILQELVALVLVGPFGAGTDRVGRRPVMAAGLAVIGVSLVLYPLAKDLGQIFLFRFLFAIGSAAMASTLAAIAADYPDNRSRGKFLATLMVTQQLALMLLIGTVAAHLPQILQKHGVEAVAAGRYAFWLMAMVAFTASVLAGSMLAKRRQTSDSTAGRTLRPVFGELIAAVHVARRNPRLALVFPIAMVARGDVSIVSTFMSLWIFYKAKTMGVGSAEAFAHAGSVFTVISVAALVSSIVSGYFLDKVSRMTALICALALSILAYGSTALISNVLSPNLYFVAALIGVSEMALIASGQAMLGEQAPAPLRGAVVGLFGVCGSIGVLAINFVGGYLFDLWSGSAPFLMVAAINATVLGYVVLGRSKSGLFAKPSPLDEEQQGT